MERNVENKNCKTPSLTIITPTFNRERTLKACYDSIAAQTCRDFQWIIIDDGSTDNTPELIEELKKDGAVEFEYYTKENGGKHTALNASHKYIKGKFVTVLDSDDTLLLDAVETILNEWKKYENENDVNVLYFYRCDKNGNPLCYVKHPNVITKTYKVRRYSNVKSRDCCDVFKTEAFIKYPFPVFPGERFIGEGAAHMNIELSGKGVYIDKAVYECEYLPDGLTMAGRKLRINNPLGGKYNANVYMNRCLPLFTRLKYSLLYNCYSAFASISLKDSLKTSDYPVLALLGFLPGRLLYFYWERKYK